MELYLHFPYMPERHAQGQLYFTLLYFTEEQTLWSFGEVGTVFGKTCCIHLQDRRDVTEP